MTLHKNKKISRRLHFHRFSWFVFMLVGLLGVQIVYNYQLTGNVQVLAYATNVNREDLFSLTNSERIAYGLSPLSLNSSLNQAAQAKAEHMITYDYWAHVAPDGTTPWFFFDQAGYSYINAGENLAYGFLTSDGTVQGWMNSPGHKANLLGDYRDVGFGYMNGATYQGGEYTVIVAMYGTPNGPSPEPEAAIAGPTETLPSNDTTPPAPVAVEPAEPAPITRETAQDTPVIPAPAQNITTDGKQVGLFSSILSTNSYWPFIASIVIISVSTIGFITTHIRLIRHSWDLGMRYVVTHPLADAAATGSVALLFLGAASGYIQ